jgi:hypothetical protein
MYLQTIGEEEATGRVAEIYAAQKSQMGFIMATAKSFTPRPDLLPIYTDFIEKVRAGFSLGIREWRLITLIAAKHIPSTYCSYVYGKQLIADLRGMPPRFLKPILTGCAPFASPISRSAI